MENRDEDGASSSNDNAKQPHILLVDHSKARSVVNKVVLTFKSPCKVSIALSAMQALEFLGIEDDNVRQSSTNGDGEHGPKVNMILTVYDMPEVNGLELLQKIKGSTLTNNVPVAILLPGDDTMLIERCLEGGANMCMKYPLKLSDVDTLLTLIRDL